MEAGIYKTEGFFCLQLLACLSQPHALRLGSDTGTKKDKRRASLTCLQSSGYRGSQFEQLRTSWLVASWLVA